MTNYDTEFHLLYALATAVSTHKKAAAAEIQTHTHTYTRIQIADYDNASLPLRVKWLKKDLQLCAIVYYVQYE